MITIWRETEDNYAVQNNDSVRELDMNVKGKKGTRERIGRCWLTSMEYRQGAQVDMDAPVHLSQKI